MQKRIIRKGLVIGIIVLFVGIAVAPSVTSIEFSNTKTLNNNDLVEIKVQLYNSDGVEDHKMFITQEQDEQLDVLIESFKADLDKAETREETIGIYNDMAVSLDKLGILPESSSCKEVQELVTGENSISNPEMKSMKHFNQAYERFKDKNLKQGGEENRNCLIAGKTTNTETIGRGTILSGKLGGFLLLEGLTIYEVFEKYNLSILGFLIYSLFALPACFLLFTAILTYFFPLKFGGNMFFGLSAGQDPNNIVDHPAKGWVYTNGLNGIKTWTKSIYGQISKKSGWPLQCLYLGAVGFTGIKTFRPFGSSFYLGTALRVKLGSEVPW